jgi:hypothetical protein
VGVKQNSFFFFLRKKALLLLDYFFFCPHDARNDNRIFTESHFTAITPNRYFANSDVARLRVQPVDPTCGAHYQLFQEEATAAL